jgi:hypothetical protein
MGGVGWSGVEWGGVYVRPYSVGFTQRWLFHGLWCVVSAPQSGVWGPCNVVHAPRGVKPTSAPRNVVQTLRPS